MRNGWREGIEAAFRWADPVCALRIDAGDDRLWGSFRASGEGLDEGVSNGGSQLSSRV